MSDNGRVIYSRAALYIDSAQSKKDKIARIDAIIDGLLTAAANSAEKDGIEEYSLNDGQTIIRTTYRSSEAIFRSIQAFERLKKMYQNELNGRMVRLIDAKSINRNHNERG